MKTLRYGIAKQHNRRVFIALQTNEQGEVGVNMVTKRLGDRKKRKIHTTVSLYSIETFELLYELMTMMKYDSEYRRIVQPRLNKILDDIATIATNMDSI